MPGRVLTPQECYTLINAIAEEVTGQQPTIQAAAYNTGCKYVDFCIGRRNDLESWYGKHAKRYRSRTRSYIHGSTAV